MGRLRIGTCSWKYPSWAGIVYSGPEPEDYLAEYSARYEAVEVDQWFWSLFKGGKVALPRRADAASYAASVPEDFRFAVKCPNSITLTEPYGTGGGGLRGAPEPRGGGEPGFAGGANPRFLDPALFLEFLDRVSPIVPKVGLFIFQFEYLNARKMPGREAFLERLGPFLDALPADLPYAVEIRNPKWFDRAWLDFLAARGVAPVFLQGYWMEEVAALYRRIVIGAEDASSSGAPKSGAPKSGAPKNGAPKNGASPGDQQKTRAARGGVPADGSPAGDRAGFPAMCLRLHGEDRGGMEEATGGDWSRIVRPKDGELVPLMAVIKDMLGRASSVFVNVNNHYEGSAPLTIGKIRRLLEAP